MLKFNSIERSDIFTQDFRDFTKNNIINFSSEGIVVVYGPNGSGKTSLINVLSDAQDTNVEFEYDGVVYTSGDEMFHVIKDQNNRNIITGETKDFFLGDNIRREFELQKIIADGRMIIVDQVKSRLKIYNITGASSSLIPLISNTEVAEIIKDIVHRTSKGTNYTTEVIVEKLSAIPVVEQLINAGQHAKLNFLISDYTSRDSIIKQVEELASQVIQSIPQVHEIEENTEAIRILERFHKDQCIVCDTEDIDWMYLLDLKINNRVNILNRLDENVKKLIENTIEIVPDNDPFNIKAILLEAISSGDQNKIVELVGDFRDIKFILMQKILNDISLVFNESKLPAAIEEYRKLIAEKPEITEEDVKYIKEVINNSMNGQELTLERDEKKNLRVTLSSKDFLGLPRNDLPLSTGEQNFLSLTFEFLKARNSPCPVVIIDDPISSFDSIYKNKVVYAIVKMLRPKKKIVLTHNTDLARLLDGQYKGCYKLYLLNNTNGEENGFIPLNSSEQDMLISLEKLISTFRCTIYEHIRDEEMFLISMVPFMRGYANIINNSELKDQLTQVMHGYKSEKVDIAKAYRELFGYIGDRIPDTYEVSVPDILSKTIAGVNILDRNQYPLLDKTLRHSFNYLFLRLLVENKLVDKYHIDTNRYKQLGQIISAAYPDENDKTQICNRIMLTSKKTLINEFNHFEGNLSIFQPAIDITDRDLHKEFNDIVNFVCNIDG